VRRSRHPTRSRSRRGIALLLALVALLVSTSICISLTRTILLTQQRVELRLGRHQADLLAHAALDRARLLLEEDPETSEHLWEVTLPDGEQGRAAIRIEPGETPQRRQVTITADISPESPHRIRTTLRTEITVRSETLTSDIRPRRGTPATHRTACTRNTDLHGCDGLARIDFSTHHLSVREDESNCGARRTEKLWTGK
jgi:hypothetical protein